MARVPTSRQTETLRPVGQANFTVRATPEQMGAAIGRGLQDLAQGGQAAADAIDYAQDMKAEIEAKEAHNAFLNGKNDLLYDPESGFMHQRGMNAVDQKPVFETEYEKLTKRHSQGLSKRAQRLFDRAAAGSSIQDNRSVNIHTGNQLIAASEETSKARQTAFFNDAVNGYQNDAIVDRNIRLGLAEIESKGAEFGFSDDVIRAQKTEFTSGIMKGVIVRRAEDDPLQAQDLFESVKDRFTAKDQAEIAHALKAPVLNAKATRNAGNILQTRREHGPVRQAGRSRSSARPAANIDAVRSDLHSRLVVPERKSDIDGLDEAFASNLSAMFNDAPADIRQGLGVLSGHRSVERQRVLWENALRRYGSAQAARKWVAPPGNSQHNEGEAVDLSYNGKSLRHAPAHVVKWVHANAAKYNMHFPLNHENWHIEPVGSRGTVAPSSSSIAGRAVRPSAGEIEAQLAAIEDPKERLATQKMIVSALNLQSKFQGQQQDQAKTALFQHIQQGNDPFSVSNEIQTAVGFEGMTAAMNYYDKLTEFGAPNTNERIFSAMRELYATDPAGFASVDLFQYRAELGDAEWKQANDWKQTALTDERKAREDGISINSVGQAVDLQIELMGEKKKPSKMTADDHEFRAKFQARAMELVNEFIEKESRKPNQSEIMKMVGTLATPVLFNQPGTFFGTNSREGFLFQAPEREDAETVEINIKYEDIDAQLRQQIAQDLAQSGVEATKAAVVERYEQFLVETSR